MNLLEEGIEQGAVIKTALTKKILLDKMDKPYPVYKVKLDWLYYNDQNDRIATWISKYKAENNGQMPERSDQESYNKVIEKFIIESNPEAITKTRNNISAVNQREPGVVLADGRIIDGNRRFTCLRELAEKNEHFGWFETVILNQNIAASAKQIKLLELILQHGVESRVDYNPIDRLVGIYNDIILTHLLTPQEYSDNTDETLPEVNKRIEIANLMVEFLNFCKAPGQFYIARDMQIYYPLEELLKLIKKCQTDEEKEQLKITAFNNILMQTAGDMTRFIRGIKPIIGTEYQDDFLKEQCTLAEKVQNALPDEGTVTTQNIQRIVKNQFETAQDLENSMERALLKVKKTETRNRPIQLAEKATTFLEGIDVNIFQKMNDSELRRLERQLNRLEQTIQNLKENL